nr:Tyrosinase and Metridin ShK toxin domain containing protein [Haemonchus contortus]
MDIQCLCVFFRGSVGAACTVQDRNLGKALRKEYRQLSDEERGRVHSAFQAIKSRVEIALRQVDPEVALPYWDSTLDENMPDSKDSIIWTNEFMGETVGGYVVGGPFREWRTLEGCPYQPNFNVLEYTHGNPHIYVGGDMFEQATSGNDPIFYMHHSFVDYIWEIYRQNVQSRSERETAYPEDNELCSSEHHFRNAFMRPFPPMRNIDGLSNKYTGEDACYNGRCIGGRCIGEPIQATPPPPTVAPKPVVVVQQSCFNEHECCSYWAGIGECPKNPIYMLQWCKASCHTCQPNYDLNNAPTAPTTTAAPVQRLPPVQVAGGEGIVF